MQATSNTVSTSTDTNLNLSPSGTGKVVTTATLKATTAYAGDFSLSGDTVAVTAENSNLAIKPHGTGKVIFNGDLSVGNLQFNGNSLASTNTDGNINLTPNGNGNVRIATAKLEVGNLRVDGNTVSATNTDGNLVLAPAGTGNVVASSPTKIENLLLSDKTISSLSTDSNLELKPNGNGKVSIGNVRISGSTIQNVGASSLSLSAASGPNIVLSAGSGKVIANNLRMSGSTVESTSGDLALTAASGQHIKLGVSGTGKVGVALASGSSPSADLEVNGDIKATAITVDQGSFQQNTAITVPHSTSDYSEFSSTVEKSITLTSEATVMVHYQVSHKFRVAGSNTDVLGYLLTALYRGNSEASSAARSASGVHRTYSSSTYTDYGWNWVTNSGFLVETLAAGTYRYNVRFKQSVCDGNCKDTVSSTENSLGVTFDTDGTRGIQIVVLGSQGSM